MVDYIGTTFPATSQWHQDEIDLIKTVKEQINQTWPDQHNLLINTTWFGPQFNNGLYQQLDQYTNKIDQIFFLSSVDAVMLNPGQLEQIVKNLNATTAYYLGNFDNQYQFTFIATLLPTYFQQYTQDELWLTEPDYLYMCYNRKPRSHRVDLVKKLVQHRLVQHGVVTLGKNDTCYSNDPNNNLYFSLDESADIVGNWSMPMTYGIPHDIHTLGDMNLWRRHFLTIASETEFLPWDNLFITEKTWKPIIGLRPFVVNGQAKIYQYLRDHGFRTFNHYWDHIPLESATELTIHDCIVDLIKYLSSQSKTELQAMWQHMRPDLEYNRQRFFEFSQEQKFKINNLFQ